MTFTEQSVKMELTLDRFQWLGFVLAVKNLRVLLPES
jgi:hypothetical protein